MQKNKTIWMIDHYSSEPKYGGISRQYDFGKELGKRGYRVVIIASGFSHFTHTYITEAKKQTKVSRLSDSVFYIYIRTSRYESNCGAARAWNMADFMNKVLRCERFIAHKYGKPDIVTGCSVHPLAWTAAYRTARKYKAVFVAEVRDFWPFVWVAGGQKKRWDPVVIFFEMLQKLTFARADRIIYSMYHGEQYICGKLGVPKDKVFLIGQPMDCERFDKNASKTYLLPEEVREFTGIGSRLGKKEFLCTFTGYYMTYEGVYVMLEAQKILQERNIRVKMIFTGSGQEKEGMEEYVKSRQIQNVLICGRISKEAVPALISNSDICMAHLEVKGHPQVYRYGVSKNKVNEYLYSGACTVYGFRYQDNEVTASRGGLMFEPYQAADLADKIEKVYRMPEQERRQFGIQGREYIKAAHDVRVLTDRMLNVLFERKDA